MNTLSDRHSRFVFNWKRILPMGLVLVVFWSGELWRNGAPDTQPAWRAGPWLADPDLHGGPEKIARSDGEVQARFRRWAREFAAASPVPKDAPVTVAEGMALARERYAHMERLICENPARALAEALDFAEWAALPPEVRALVEKPFSVMANYHFYPVCGRRGEALPPGASTYIAELDLGLDKPLRAYVYGRNLGLMSKRDLPIQGIALAGLAALREGTFQGLSDKEVAVARTLFAEGQPDPSRSMASGERVGAGALQAVAGGKLYTFADADELARVNLRLAKLDARPGPVAVSGGALVLADAADGTGGGINWGVLEAKADSQASAWTETKKKLFLIRVNFTDNTTDPVSQADAEAVMNHVASESIRDMSYHKTWVEAAASTNLYTLPQTAAYYVNGGNNSLNGELMRDARNTFRTNKSGADAAIDIGPVSNNSNGDDGGLGEYDIVGVTFANIGMFYAGLAGGADLWMQGNNDAGIYCHEWGHNYGLGHASSWETTDGSVIGPGTSNEYGDPFDNMGSGPLPEGHFHPQGKARLNWLGADQWTDATAGGSATYRIHRIDDPSTTNTASRGIRLTRSATPGSEEYYWLAYRPAFGSNPALQRGAYLIWQRPGESRCWLLDNTPGTPDGMKDASLDIGRTYADDAANIFLTPLGTGGAGADRYLDVRVNLGPFPGNHAPAATPITGPATVPARTSAAFSFSATDADADTLAYWWDTQNGVPNDSSVMLNSAWPVGGTYTLTAVASDMKGGQSTVTKSIIVTDPLEAWTQQGTGHADFMRAVVWGKGRFVAAEYWGTLFLSWDGTNWNNVGVPPAFDSDPLLAFGGNVFVVGGKKTDVAAAQLCYSADGRIWQQASFPAGVPQIRRLAYGDGKFIAVADGGTVLTSTNGSGWSLTTVGEGPNFRFVTWDGTAWLALAMNDAGTSPEAVWTSPDAVSWSRQGDLGVSADGVFARDGAMFVTGWYAGVKYSTNHGATWNNAYTPGNTRWSTRQMAAADDGTLLLTATAMDESGYPNALLVSTDGIRWFRSSAASGAAVAGGAQAITFGAGRFLAVEAEGIVRTCESFYPSNTAPAVSFAVNPASFPARQTRLFAATATDAEGDPLTYSWDFGAALPVVVGGSLVREFDFGGAYTATLRVSDGRGGLTTLSYAFTVSDPARAFTQRASGTSSTLHAIATDGATMVAVGDNGTILTSTNGVAWTTRTVPDFDFNIYFQAAAWDGTKFLIAGQDYDFNINGWVAVIYSSPNGSNWTRRFFGAVPDSQQLEGLACDGSGGAVAVGTGGTVLSSANGFSWSTINVSGAPDTFAGAAWHGGGYVIVGYSGGNGAPKVFTSTDRTNWTDTTSGAGLASWHDLRKVTWLHDRFVASGWFSRLRVSTNQGATFTTTRAVTEEIPAMAYGDGLYFAAGVDYDHNNAAVDVLSRDGVSWLSFGAPTADERRGAVFFQHTFITVGANGSIWQSGDTTPVQRTNHAPLAANLSLATRAHVPASFRLSKHASDPDGDSLFVGFGPFNHGGQAVHTNEMVTYTPAVGFVGTETFLYTVSDPYGGSAAATVTATVGAAAASPNCLDGPVITNGIFVVRFAGVPGQPYTIEASDSLAPPNWQKRVNATAPAANQGLGIGAFEFREATGGAAQRFFRSVWPAY
jgi:hypothetical protein